MGRVEEAGEMRSGGGPLYAGVKQSILDRIQAGIWPVGGRIPSENELVAELGVSRMTVHRALRELALEGVLVRVQGLGTFVAEGKGQSSVFEVKNIADEIAARGHAHAARLVLLDRVKATPEVAERLALSIGHPVFHSILVHAENDIPVQIEDRWVNPELAPDYADQDFSTETPNAYLSRIAPWTEAEHAVEAVLPEAWEVRLLGIGRGDPCLRIDRRTFLGHRVVTAVRLTIPGGRYRIESRTRAGGSPDLDVQR